MASTQTVQNLASLGKNKNATTAAGMAKGVKVRGSGRVGRAWAKITGAVKSSALGRLFAAHPLACSFFGGALIDASIEGIYYGISRKHLKEFSDACEATGGFTLIEDITECEDWDNIREILDHERTMGADFIADGPKDPRLNQMLAVYIGALQDSNENYMFTTDDQGIIDAMCIVVAGVLSADDRKDAAQLDAAVNNAYDVTDTETLRELAEELADEYSDARTPLAMGVSRGLDFQSFVRLNHLQNLFATLNDTPSIYSVDQVPNWVADATNGDKIRAPGSDPCKEYDVTTDPLDVDSLIEGGLDSVNYYED